MNKIGRRSFIGQSMAAVALASFGQTAALAQRTRGRIDPSGSFGSLLNDNEFANTPHILDPAILSRFISQAEMRGVVRSGTARRHVLSNLPPVEMQGTLRSMGFPGSCEAQSFGYGLGTYTAAHGYPGFDPQVGPANQISAAFLFAWAQANAGKTTCQGSLALPYLALLVKVGAPSAAQVPYKPNCRYIHGINANVGSYFGTGKFAIGSYRSLPNFRNKQSMYLGLLKQYLNAGHAIAFSGLVPRGYDNPASTMVNGAYDPQRFIPKSGHGQLIVGYDDSLGHTGAFLIQNSFGTDWPYLGATHPLTQGRLWWTYESFFASQGFGTIAYPKPQPPVYPHTVVLTSSNSSAPPARIFEAVRADQNGESYAVFETEFARPVRLESISVTPPRGSAILGGYKAPIKYGFTHVARSTPFPSGRYAIELSARTISAQGAIEQPVTYRGYIRID
jgi:hypothetical protein